MLVPDQPVSTWALLFLISGCEVTGPEGACLPSGIFHTKGRTLATVCRLLWSKINPRSLTEGWSGSTHPKEADQGAALVVLHLKVWLLREQPQKQQMPSRQGWPGASVARMQGGLLPGSPFLASLCCLPPGFLLLSVLMTQFLVPPVVLYYCYS